MLVSKAYARHTRVSPRKAKLVIDLIRGEKIGTALAILANTNKRAVGSVEKLLKSAVSNAKQSPTVNADELFISRITADKGPMLKRYRAAAMGRATMIRHRSTHLTIELSQAEVKKVKKAVKKTVAGKTQRTLLRKSSAGQAKNRKRGSSLVK
jgi:large subunit ribosomal protein L22